MIKGKIKDNNSRAHVTIGGVPRTRARLSANTVRFLVRACLAAVRVCLRSVEMFWTQLTDLTEGNRVICSRTSCDSTIRA